MLDCGRGHSGIKLDNRNPQDWLAGESQWARGHLKEVGSERLFRPRDGRPDPSLFNLYPPCTFGTV
jgi:hypothetical protein